MNDKRDTKPHINKKDERLTNLRSHESVSYNPISQTEVNTCLGVWGGRRKVVGVRVDETLYKAFKPVAKAVFGSVCRPIECFMASVVAIAKEGVNFGKTIEVKEIKIERNLRPRRRVGVEERAICGHADCHEAAVGVGVWRGRSALPLCEKHFDEAERFPDWSDLRVPSNVKDDAKEG